MASEMTAEPRQLTRLDTSHFLLMADSDGFAARALPVIGTRLESAYSAVVEHLELQVVPEGPIEVLLQDAADLPLMGGSHALLATAELRTWSGPPWQLQLLYLPDHPAPNLEEAVAHLLLACSTEPFVERTPMLAHGLLRYAAERRGSAEGASSPRLAALRRQGEPVSLGPVIGGPGKVPLDLYFDIAASFVGFLIERYGPDAFSHLAVKFDPQDPNSAAEAAYRKPLAVLEMEWTQSLRDIRPPAPGVADFLRLSAGHLRRNWLLVSGLLIAVLLSLSDPLLRPILSRSVLDEVVGERDPVRLVELVMAMIGVLLFNSLAVLMREYLAGRLGAAVASETPARVFHHLQQLSLQFFATQRANELAGRIREELDSVQTGLSTTLVQGTSVVLTLVASGSILLWVDWRLALFTFVVMAIVFAGPALVYAKVEKARKGRKFAGLAADRTLVETLGNMALVRVFGNDQPALERYRDQMMTVARNTVLRGFWRGLETTSTVSGAALAQVAVFVTGAFMVLNGAITVGSLYLFTSMVRSLSTAYTEMTRLSRPIRSAAGAMEFIEELLAEPPINADRPHAVPMDPPSREIMMTDVTFSYTGEQVNLRDLNLRIPVGQQIAIVGSSGSGKSTLLAMLLRLYDPNIGRVTIDGHPLSSIQRASLRRHLAAVLQDTPMVTGTIADNIRFGLAASAEEVERAARVAQIHDFIASLPKGYETEVGVGGARLSGGQRQRINLARALLRNAPILVLDEATSALDPETEAAVYAELRRAYAGRTLLYATHRLETVTQCDQIVVLENGRVAEQGTHAELLTLNGVYAQLWHRQHAVVVAEADDSLAPRIELLKTIRLLAHLESGTLARMANRFAVEELPGGEALFNQGDPGDKLYIVLSGTLDVILNLPAGARRRLATLRDGDYFGEMALLADSPRTASIIARSPVRLLALDQASFNNLLHMEPGLRTAIETIIAERRKQNAATVRKSPE